MKQALSIHGIGVYEAPLNQIRALGSIVFFRQITALSSIWHHKQPLSGTKALFIDLPITALRACLAAGAGIQPSVERRYLSRQGTDKKIQIIRYRQSGAVALALWITQLISTDCLFVEKRKC